MSRKKPINCTQGSKFLLADYLARKIIKGGDIKEVTKHGFRIKTFKKFLKTKYGIQI